MTPDRQFRRVGMSPFLAELGPGLYERVTEAGIAREWTGPTEFSAPVAPGSLPVRPGSSGGSGFTKGCKVSHPFSARAR